MALCSAGENEGLSSSSSDDPGDGPGTSGRGVQEGDAFAENSALDMAALSRALSRERALEAYKEQVESDSISVLK